MTSPKEQAMNWLEKNNTKVYSVSSFHKPNIWHIKEGMVEEALDIALKAQAEAIFKEIKETMEDDYAESWLEALEKKWLGEK